MLTQVDVPLEITDVKITSSMPLSLAGEPVLTMRAVLKNRGKHALRLWDPNNTEGSMSLFASFKPTEGPAIELRALPIPRAGGVPTSIMLAPTESITLTAEFGWSLKSSGVTPGYYSLTFIYRNRTASSGPVRAVWTGSVKSKALTIKLVR